jgi:hypothetical protein
MKHFDTSAKSNIDVDKVFMSLIKDILNVDVHPAVCSLVCNCRHRVACAICPRAPFLGAPAYAELQRVIDSGGVSCVRAFAAATMPLNGLANLVRVPILSRAQQLLLISCCGHARHYINSVMSPDIPRGTCPRHMLLLRLFGSPTVSRIEDADFREPRTRSTGGSMAFGPQLRPSDAAWQPNSSCSSCACCRTPFDWLNHRHHCRLDSVVFFIAGNHLN